VTTYVFVVIRGEESLIFGATAARSLRGCLGRGKDGLLVFLAIGYARLLDFALWGKKGYALFFGCLWEGESAFP
jgi:hypothetical protein